MDTLITELEGAAVGSQPSSCRLYGLLETATKDWSEPDNFDIRRETEWLIHKFVGKASKDELRLAEKQGVKHADGYWFWNVPPYTTSLDAALPWENIEQVALHDIVEGEPLGEVWEAWHVDRDTGQRTMGSSHTEALARRIAALRARQVREEET